MSNMYRPTKLGALLANVLYAAHKTWAMAQAGRTYHYEGLKSLYTSANSLMFQD